MLEFRFRVCCKSFQCTNTLKIWVPVSDVKLDLNGKVIAVECGSFLREANWLEQYKVYTQEYEYYCPQCAEIMII